MVEKKIISHFLPSVHFFVFPETKYDLGFYILVGRVYILAGKRCLMSVLVP